MPACPFLPTPGHAFTHEDMHALGDDRGGRFHDAALNYAQSLWLAGFPARAILLINRALACRLPDVSLNGAASPYHAIAWILSNRPPDRFIGNPRRHFQHLATRMVEPHKELRIWRAWACWYLSRLILDEHEFPPDGEQIREEGIIEPRRSDITQQLARLSPRDDREAWESALHWAESPAPGGPGDSVVRPIGPEHAQAIHRLAREIWPEVYPPMISEGQIEYMLDRMYDPAVIRDEVTRGVRYALILGGGEEIGYLAWEAVGSGAETAAFVHKLYLRPAHRGRGVGAAALRWIEGEARACGLPRLRLRVNRGNARAIRAYLRAGFSFESELRSDIGGGFVMDDYVLVKPLGAALTGA